MNNLIKNKKFLLVISKFPPEYSGPGVRIPRLYDWFKENNHDINLQVICNGIEEIKNENYIHKGYKVRRITAEYMNKFFLCFKFIPRKLSQFAIYQYEFVKTFLVLNFSKTYKNIDFLHVAGHSGGTAAALLWAKIKNIPVLMELVTEHARPIQKFLSIFKINIPQNSILITLTKKSSKNSIFAGISESQIWHRPNPIDEKKFYPELQNKINIRKTHTRFDESNIIISNVAKIIPQKNQCLILKILKHLPDHYVAIIAGPFIKEGPLYERDSKYLNQMKDYINAHNLEKRVQLITDFVDAEKFMKLADIYAMPAWNEGFGTPMMEAIACGIPVVANQNEAAFQEWIKEGENGFLCDVEQPEKWAEAIEKASKFLEDQCLEQSKIIHKKAGQQVIYNHYEAVIKKLLGDQENHESSR